MKKYSITIIIALLLIIVGSTNIYATEPSGTTRTDFSNVKLTVEGLTENSHANAYIKISDAVVKENTYYYALLTKDNQTILDSFEVFNEPENLCQVYDNLTITTDYISMAEKYGDVYVTFYEYETNTYTKITEPILVKRPEELKLTKRVSAYLFDDENAFFLHSIHDNSITRKVNYKIGKITDNNILKNIKTGNYSGLESLLTYAKNSSDVVTSGQVELKSGLSPIFEQNDIVENDYYYMYIEVDTENGKYYPIEDVEIYLAMNHNNKLWLCNRTDSNFIWNIDENSSITEWEKFVEAFKNNAFTKEYKNKLESSGESLSIEHDSSSLKITVNFSNGTIITTFNHANGIVSYIADDNVDSSELAMANVWIEVALDVLCNKFGYNTQNVMSFLENNNNLTLEKDGIEFTSQEVTITENSGSVNTNISMSGFNMIKFDIINGLKTYVENQPEVEDNTKADKPIAQAGIDDTILIVMLITVIAGVVVAIKYKKLKDI